ncbi:MAG: 3-hydroxypropionyl-CoA synthetase [Gemmatimonas sp. SG8_38_2]|nr:MAG: 3-hydroxypropionyl-CoA synthetase [Gemmatimonas sp. SG8_38_2]
MANASDTYSPSKEITEASHVPDYDALRAQAAKDPEGFWEARARELEWYRPWEKVLDDSEAPFYKWFVGAKTNVILNALDRHQRTATRNKLALVWEGEDGVLRTFSYFALNREVCQFANILKSMGVNKGDRVTIYMPRIPELMMAMLACAKIGAVHSVVYGGFSVEALAGRIEDSESRVLITADGGYLRGKIVPLKKIADEALERCGTIEHVVVVRRTGEDVAMEADRDYFYDELMSLPIARSNDQKCATEEMDAEDPLFMLYTSGTTGKPKAIVHTHGGYQVGIATTLKYAFDLKDEDRWWCAADPGWITGHSYIVYGPLILGATSIMYEGAPTHPYPDRWWRIVEKYGVTILYTAPTAIRGLMRFGQSWVNKHDTSTLRLLGSVGEPINPEAWRWYYEVVGKERCPIIDTWWQTETGAFMITPVPSFPLKPGSGTKPFPGVQAEILDEEGNPVPVGEEGKLVITTPWPSMLRGIYKDPDRYVQQYWSTYPGKYLTGDSAKVDEDGYFWIIGRMDDVIKVSGYRLGTAEIESALVSHHAVAEAAAIGIPHDVRGNVINTYVILRSGFSDSPELAEELIQHVGKEVGPIAKPALVEFVESLPKTRSGKIMRRLLKARALGLPEGDTTTLEA